MQDKTALPKTDPNPSGPGTASRRLFGALAEAMPAARRSLNRVAEEFVFLGD
jgi:hypothetical protein